MFDEEDRATFRKALDRNDIEIGDVLEEEPCVPQAMLEQIEKRDGRPCPRAELSEDNLAAWHVFELSLAAATRPLVPYILDGLPPEERAQVAMRASGALLDEMVNDELAAIRKRAFDAQRGPRG